MADVSLVAMLGATAADHERISKVVWIVYASLGVTTACGFTTPKSAPPEAATSRIV